jgi:hypothetical protein
MEAMNDGREWRGVAAMKCKLCDEEWPDEDGGLESAVDHLRVMHPDKYEPPERWPDGQIVIHDANPEIGDFE